MTNLREELQVALALFPFWLGAFPAHAQTSDSGVEAHVVEAREVARSEYGLILHLDWRDVGGLATILERIRDRNAKAPIPEETLRAEVYRWGSVLGEIQLSIWSRAHWGPSREHNKAYSHSVYVPLEGGGWLESNEFDLAERLITAASSELTIRQTLTLHLLD